MWWVIKGRIVYMVVTCECQTSIIIYEFNI